jgi:hypothetical protein
MQTVRRNQLGDIVIPHKGNSTTWTQAVSNKFKCKLAFLDGDHSYKAVCEDIHNIEKFLIDGGWICFDDAFSYYDGVNRAIEECIIGNPSYSVCQQMTRKLFVAQRAKENNYAE